MVKRGAERQLTKDDREEEDDNDQTNGEGEGNGSFTRANEEVIQKRRIVKVARTTDGKVDFSKKKSNPFASVNLASSATTAATGTTTAENKDKSTSTSKVFGSSTDFSGFGSVAASGGTTSGFGSSATSGGGFGGAAASSSGFTFAKTMNSSGSGGFGFGTAKGFGEAAKSAAEDSSENKEEGKESSEATGAAGAASPGVLPQDYQLQSGEEGFTVVLERRCKTHRWLKETELVKKEAEAAAVASTTKDASVAPALAVPTMSPKREKDGEEDDKKEETKDKSSEDNGKWVDVGTGPMRVLRQRKQSSSDKDATTDDAETTLRIVQRRETTPNGPGTKVLVNVPVWKDSHISQPSEKHLKLMSIGTASPSDASEADQSQTVTYLFKFKLPSEAMELKQLLEKEKPNLKTCLSSASEGKEEKKAEDAQAAATDETATRE